MSSELDAADARLANLVERALEAFEERGEAGLEEFCRSHPNDRAAIRARIGALREAGLLGAAEAPTPTKRERLGEYEILEKIGEGGMGVVFLARHRALGRRVALKAVRPEHMLFEVARERFRREVEAVARLRHQGIVPIHSVGEQDGMPYFAMELVDGCSLAEVIRSLQGRSPASLTGADAARAVAAKSASREGAPSSTGSGYVFEGTWAETCCRLLRQTADALEHAHRKGVVHRDVKPNNLMATPAGHVLLLDFGLARSEGTEPLTRTGVELGSLPYLAPEQIDAARGEVGPRTDVYGLGVTLYELLCLGLPFAMASAEELRRAILAGRPARVRARNPAVSWELETVCETAMELDPARRYASAADFGRDLENVLTRRPIEARRAGPVLRLKRWAQRNPATATAAALTTLLVIGAPLGYGIQQHAALVALESLHRRTDGLRLAALSSSHVATDPPLALRLALEAHERAPGFIARNAVYAALAAQDEAARIGGHGGGLVASRFTRDGSLVLTASGHGELRASDARTGAERYAVQAHDARIATLDLSRDGAWALTASSEGTLAIWSVADGALRLRIQEEPLRLAGAAFSPSGDRLVTWSKAGTATIRRAADGAPVARLAGHAKEITEAAWSERGDAILTRASDGTARLWRADNGACTRVLTSEAAITDARLSPAGDRIATTERNGPARLWSVAEGPPLLTYREDERPLPLTDFVVWSPDGERLLVVSRDHDARIYRAETGEWLGRLRGHDRLLNDAAWSPDGRRVATTGDDRTIRVWNSLTGESLAVLTGHRGTVRSLGFSPDGERLVSVSGEARVWRAPASRVLSPDRAHAGKLTRCYFTADGEGLTSAAHDGFGRLFRWRNSAPWARFGPLRAAATVVDVHATTGRAAVGDFDGAVGLFDLDGILVRELSLAPHKIATVTFSPEGSRLLVTSSDPAARLWDLTREAAPRLLAGHDDPLVFGSFSRDGRFVATGDRGGEVRVFDADSGECLRTIAAHKRAVSCVRFDATGARLVTASSDQSAALWDWASGTPIFTLPGHGDIVWTARVSDDGRWIATGGHDRQVRLWNGTTGELEATLRGHEDLISDVLFVDGGRALASVAGHGGVRIWPVDALEAGRRACTRTLTTEERLGYGVGSADAWRAAEEWVARWRGECALVREVRARAETEPGLDEAVRAAARELARDLRDDPRELTNQAWEVVVRASAKPEEYAKALRRAEEAVRRGPDAKDFARALGVARYRAGDFAGAIEVLSRPELVRFCDAPEEPAVTLGFLALAHARAGNAAEARQTADEMGAAVGALPAPSEFLAALAAEVDGAAR